MSKYLDHITSNHELYDRYYDDWKMCINSYYGGTEYKSAKYLRAYTGDFNTPGETINTYMINSDGSVVSQVKAKVEHGISSDATLKGQDIAAGSFYGEKLDHTPLYNYVKLIVSEYNSILFRNPPYRNLPEIPETYNFIRDVDGEGNNLNEFMSMVDVFTTIYGVCHVACYKPIGSDVPRWKIHSPLDVTNWSYRYDDGGNLKLNDIVIKLEDCEDYSVYRYITRDEITTVFVGSDADYIPDVDSPDLMQIDDGVYQIVQPNELGYVPVVTVYQSTKVYNGIGSTVIQDIAQIQRSVYGDMAEIYSAITYNAHPTLVVDEITDQLNDGQIGAEPGSVVRVQNSVTGEANYVYEFVAPQLDAIGEIRDLVDNKIQKMLQTAMLRTEDLIRSSRSGEQIQMYDDKLAGLIRRKATNLENSEARLWAIWADWLNTELPGDFVISYNRQYNKKALLQELEEIQKLMEVLNQYSESVGSQDVEFQQGMRERIQLRLQQLLQATSTENGL